MSNLHSRSRPAACWWAVTVWLLAVHGTPAPTIGGSLDAAEPDSAAAGVFEDAVAVWPFADARDATWPQSDATVVGAARLGVELSEDERQASLARGGDGQVASLEGGYLNAGQGAAEELRFSGARWTGLLRLKVQDRQLWATRGLFTKGGGHDGLVFNFFNWDAGQGPDLMRIGCEIGLEGQAGLGAQVAVHLDRVGFDDWHDVVGRFDGQKLALFIDGVLLDERHAIGTLRTGNREPVLIGAGSHGAHVDAPFPGLIDHAALWNRALSDDEIGLLSGGPSVVAERRRAFANYVPPQPGQETFELVKAARQLADKFQHDPHRPRYHFLVPEEGEAMPADPNGAIFWKGRYHLFYIFQRQQTAEPQTVHCWGHASSLDLLHWEHHPTALDVAEHDVDRGIFSGNAFVDLQGTPTILYHGVNAGNAIATSTDPRLIHWTKLPTNPIVRIPRPGEADFGKYESWDPHGWVEGDSYFAIFGGAKPALFRGPDMSSLAHIGPFLTSDRWSEAGEDISCPDFFPLGDRHALVCISHMRGARYFIGRWDGRQFQPESHGRMNWPGGGYFAPETLIDARGRRILWAWCLDERPPATRARSGWSGVMGLPRVLSLDEQGLKIEPAEELQRLRYNERQIERFALHDGQPTELPGISGDGLEIELTLEALDSRECVLAVRRTPDAAEETQIVVDLARKELKIDVSRSTLDPTIQYRTWCITRPASDEEFRRRVTEQVAPLPPPEDGRYRLRVFLDRSMLEVFVNDRQCVTQRVWPTRRDAVHVAAWSRGGSATMRDLRAWDMDVTSPH